MHAPLFGELVVILGLAAGILLLFRRFRLPGILGFIVTGIIAGPHGLGWVHEVESVEAMAEIGVILLLFVIGMEFSLKKLASLGRTVFIGGLLQAGLTTAAVTFVLGFFGMRTESAIFIGFLVTLSSTAIVLRVLQEQGKMDAAHGRASTAILIFQDIIVVPMMLVTPMLAGKSSDLSGDLLLLLGKMVLLLVAVFVSGRYVVPRILKQAVKGKGNELFIITIVVICFAAAYATQALGLSLALGAFFAGLIISETDHAYHATGIILPFHELFMSFFFVSIGMLVDLDTFLASPFMILMLFVGMTGLKVLAAMMAVWVLRYPLRTAMMTGLALFQLGEFGFILAMPGLEEGLLSEAHYQQFLTVAILSMGATPFMLEYADRIVRRAFLSFVPARAAKRLDRMVRVRQEQDRSQARILRDHLVIIGFGLNGQNVASSALNSGVNCVVVESDPDLAEKARKLGLVVLVGDGAQVHLLERAHVERARVVVVAVSDAAVTRNIVVAVRSLSSAAHVIVRTRYVREMRSLLDVGANDVIPEEFETSIQIFHRVLRRYLVPEDRIQELIGGVRRDHYGLLRGQGTNRLKSPTSAVSASSDMDLVTITVTLGHNKVVGQTLAALQLRERCGIQLLAIRRGGRFIAPPPATERILTDDLLYLLGTPDDVARLERQLR
jgi:CPA2 family monovalent cation:H+ antiporter-2